MIRHITGRPRPSLLPLPLGPHPTRTRCHRGKIITHRAPRQSVAQPASQPTGPPREGGPGHAGPLSKLSGRIRGATATTSALSFLHTSRPSLQGASPVFLPAQFHAKIALFPLIWRGVRDAHAYSNVRGKEGERLPWRLVHRHILKRVQGTWYNGNDYNMQN